MIFEDGKLLLTITVVETHTGCVKLGIDAPPNLDILRAEVVPPQEPPVAE